MEHPFSKKTITPEAHARKQH